MITLEEAKNRILSTIKRRAEEVVPVWDSLNRICSKKIIATRDLPMFDTADVDGYALMTSDVLMATEDYPAELSLVATIKPGECYEGELNSGECVRVFCGSKIPKGADAIVPGEFARASQKKENRIEILASARPWQNIRKRGEDLMYGAVISLPGDKITTARATLLASLGVKNVPVVKQPKLRIISIGSELRKPGEEITGGEVYESNSIMIAAMVKKHIVENVERILIPDDENKIYETLEKCFQTSDVIITTGRAATGQLDILKNVLAKFQNLKFEDWRIIIKPGRPFIFGNLMGDKYFFGLSGNPVSAAVSYSLLVRPALLKMLGYSNLEMPSEEGELLEDISNPGNRRHFIRVNIDHKKRIRPAILQTSYSLSSLLNSNGIIDVPPHSILRRGSLVKVLMWEVAE